MPIQTQLLPPPGKDFNDAKRQYMEQFGSALVTNMYLRVAVLCLSLVSVGALYLNFLTYSRFTNVKPLVIRIDGVGRAEAVNYDASAYKPQAAELKYFLTRFVHDHYARNRATVRDDYARSLFFLDAPLAEAKMDQNRKAKDLESVLIGAQNEIEVNVQNIIIQDLRIPPYRATVDFEKIHLTGPQRSEVRREKYVGSLVFSLRDIVPNSMIPVNPLGIAISYYREDQAFGVEDKKVIGNAIFLASALILACAMYVLSELTFLSRYRDLIVGRYLGPIVTFAVLLFTNLFALIYVANRALFLKDTGRKLAHVEKQLRTGSSISEELSRQLAD